MQAAILSDIHEGINRKNTQTDILGIIDRWISTHSPDLFIIAGDMTAKPEKALSLLNQLQHSNPQTQILFVHGNHDVYDQNSITAYDTLLQFKGNLGNGPVHVNDDWVIIGDGGWYDYSFGMPEYTEEQFAKGTYNTFTWPDKQFANWRETDIKVTNHFAAKLENQLQENQHKKMIMVTHTVPFEQYIQIKNEPSWDFFNSMMGARKFGELAVKYGVKKYIFGHIHTRYHRYFNDMEIICNPLGYFPHEWNHQSPEEEIYSAIKVIDI